MISAPQWTQNKGLAKATLGTALICMVGLRLLRARNHSAELSRASLGTALICMVGLRLSHSTSQEVALALHLELP